MIIIQIEIQKRCDDISSITVNLDSPEYIPSHSQLQQNI